MKNGLTGLCAPMGELVHDGHLLTGVGTPYDIGEAIGDVIGDTPCATASKTIQLTWATERGAFGASGQRCVRHVVVATLLGVQTGDPSSVMEAWVGDSMGTLIIGTSM
eukprot:CAMPEP_0197656874 /NCGR_PEP_ID=MMETSP1338-20131121/43774_1 /TAXON_ID=43686 ORGANISM="Pelagodinium beii, Strain RCC1491" /NCGR_SAMPLE_ID=MMETSP1338 /ASSEMBLY_ACC=CAM_ASM_000754 /LENGTH=107 /DNA_ID=CAMNT_0043233093 /DNA_START=452 /DNA_END=775 /DNA_ORIENTATION=-